MSARRLAILRALVRPELWLGCDRTLLILLATVAAMLAGPAGVAVGRYWAAAVGGALFAVGVGLLRSLGKREPFAKEVFWRAGSYRERYVARARWDINGAQAQRKKVRAR